MKINLMKRKQTYIRLIVILSIITSSFVLFHFLAAPIHAGNRSSLYSECGRIENGSNFIYLTLLGVTHYELTEIFNDILLRTPGLVDAERVRLHLDPNRPRACYVTWKLKVRDVGLFELESRIYRIVKDIAHDSPDAPAIAFSFAPTQKERRLLGYIRPFQSSSREIEFIMDHPSSNIQKHVNRKFRMREKFPPNSDWGHRGFE